MMDGIRQWLLGILAAAMGLSLLYALLPKGAVRAAAKATGGLILLLAVLGPAAGLDLSDLAVRYKDLSRDMEQQAETYRRELQALCRDYHVPFIVNDNVDIALAMDADGVHVGQSDMEALDVRRKLGPDKIIGVSAQTVEQALLAEKHGADYLGVGAVFPTGSKDDADDVSYDTLKAICRAVSIPVVAIGGISLGNVSQLSGSGICGIAVISAIYGAADIRRASLDLKAATEEMLRS